MQLEDFSGYVNSNTPPFMITSKDSVAPQTWALPMSAWLVEPSIILQQHSYLHPYDHRPPLPPPPPPPPPPLHQQRHHLPSLLQGRRQGQIATNILIISATLNTAAKAGIRIGSVFCAFALIIIVLFHIMHGHGGQEVKSKRSTASHRVSGVRLTRLLIRAKEPIAKSME